MTNMLINQGKKFFALIYNKHMNDKINNGIITAGSTYLGLCTYYNTSVPLLKISRKTLNNCIKINSTPQFTQFMYNAAGPIIQKNGLYDYGIRIADCSKSSGHCFIQKEIENYEKSLNKRYDDKNNVLLNKFFNAIKKTKLKKFKRISQEVLDGKNAYYKKSKKVIVINMDKFSHALLHELGHAINHKSLKNKEHLVYDILKNEKRISRTLLTIMLISFFTNKKDNSEKQNKNPMYQIASFIKNNCGKLAFLVLLPKLAEETIASIQGHKISKKFIPPEYLNIIKKSHLRSFSSYAAYTLITAFSVYLANQARDYTVMGAKKLIQFAKNKRTPKINNNKVNI